MSNETVEMVNVAEAVEISKDENSFVMVDEAATVEFVSEDEDTKKLCYCMDCEGAILQFYPDYLTYVKKLPSSEVSHKTMSQHRTMQWGCNTIQSFIDALWSENDTITREGFELTEVWKVVNDAYFCDQQVAIWKKQLLARKLINE